MAGNNTMVVDDSFMREPNEHASIPTCNTGTVVPLVVDSEIQASRLHEFAILEIQGTVSAEQIAVRSTPSSPMSSAGLKVKLAVQDEPYSAVGVLDLSGGAPKLNVGRKVFTGSVVQLDNPYLITRTLKKYFDDIDIDSDEVRHAEECDPIEFSSRIDNGGNVKYVCEVCGIVREKISFLTMPTYTWKQ